MATLLFAGLPFIPAFFYRLGTLIANYYVLGFNPAGFIEPEVISSYIIPVTWASHWGRNQSWYFVAYVAIALVMLLLANASFISRKIERGENMIVFNSVKNVLIFLLSLIGMLAMGGYMISLLTGRWFLYYGFVLGFAITFCVAQMVFEKSFRITQKVKWIMPLAGVVAALYGIMLFVTSVGMRGYTHQVPVESQVWGVYISQEAQLPTRDDFVTEREEIAETIVLHEQILDIHGDLTRRQIRDMTPRERREIREEQRDHRKDVRDAFWQSVTGGGIQFDDDGGEWIYITYRLHNGDRILRRYALSGALMERLGLVELPDEYSYST
jgi:hypothetical protein